MPAKSTIRCATAMALWRCLRREERLRNAISPGGVARGWEDSRGNSCGVVERDYGVSVLGVAGEKPTSPEAVVGVRRRYL